MNNWEIQDKIGQRNNGSFIYNIRCKCGNIYQKTIGETKRIKQCSYCDLKRRNEEAEKRHLDLIGKKFKSWTVIKKTKTNPRGTFFLVQCDCGNTSEMLPYKFIHGLSTKCLACSKVKHNKCNTRTYRIWAGIIQRCHNHNTKSYKYYGGRGIKVCDSWRFSFENFLNDMNECSSLEELDRINPDGDYEKSNCRWVTKKENQQNKRRSLQNQGRFIIIDKNKLCEKCQAS